LLGIQLRGIGGHHIVAIEGLGGGQPTAINPKPQLQLPIVALHMALDAPDQPFP